MRSPEEIRKIFKDNNITGYRIERDLGISQVGADKFLNGDTKKPFSNTLKTYNSYINNNFTPINNNTLNNFTEGNGVKTSIGIISLKELAHLSAEYVKDLKNESVFYNTLIIEALELLKEAQNTEGKIDPMKLKTKK